ncbi:MAG: hypothetical protein GF330_14175 [Candidatus Eisenbacteria bacterium]|nr:hypothetical protein [Candidatus Eisenbacteria bacterium]
MAVIDAAGRLVDGLAEDPLPAGTHDLVWEGMDHRAHPAPPGVSDVRRQRCGAWDGGRSAARSIAVLR